MPLSSHPSGVNLADPPEGTAPSFSAAPAMRSLPSRRSSKTLLALPSLRSVPNLCKKEVYCPTQQRNGCFSDSIGLWLLHKARGIFRK